MLVNSYSLAERVNREVNQSTTYCTDSQQYGLPEYWEPDRRFGDCEDYALTKLGNLLAAGWDADKMGLCLCRINLTGEGHVVLWVDTDRGGFILDNRYSHLVDPDFPDYEWSSMLRGGKWYKLECWR